MSDVGLGVTGPGLELLGELLGEALDGEGGAAVGVTLAEDRVYRGTEDLGVLGPDSLLFGGLGVGGEVGDLESLALELSDGFLELRNGGGDVGQLDDVAIRSVGELTELVEVVSVEVELSEDAAGDGDVGEFDTDTGGLEEALEDGEESVGGESGGFISEGVLDGGKSTSRASEGGNRCHETSATEHTVLFILKFKIDF